MNAQLEEERKGFEKSKLDIISESEARVKKEESKRQEENREYTKIFHTQLEEEKRKLEERFRTEYEYRLHVEKQKACKELREKNAEENGNTNVMNAMNRNVFDKEYDEVKREIVHLKSKKTVI